MDSNCVQGGKPVSNGIEWEVTPEDVYDVLNAHGLVLPSCDFDTCPTVRKAYKSLNHQRIIERLLTYVTMTEQVESMMHDIEDELKEKGIIPPSAEVKFPDPITISERYYHGDETDL